MIDYREENNIQAQTPRLDRAVKQHMDSLVEEARKLAVKQAKYNLEEQVIAGKALKGLGHQLSKEQDKQIMDNIKSNINIIGSQSHGLDAYLVDWEKRKNDLGISHLENAPKDLIGKEQHKFNSAVV